MEAHQGATSGWTLRIAAYAAAFGFCSVSLYANARFGSTLGTGAADRIIYIVVSLSADLFKIAAPLMALGPGIRKSRLLAAATLSLWLGCVAWSVCSAVGFALSTRSEAAAERTALSATRHGWEATVKRAETQLATLGGHRPAGVIKAELAALAVAPPIWRRSRQCRDLSSQEIRAACGPVLARRSELAASEAAEALEKQLLAGRAQLGTVAGAGSPDTQAQGLAQITGMSEARVRGFIAVLLAAVIEAGSALGFALAAATHRSPPPPAPEILSATTRRNPPPNHRTSSFARREAASRKPPRRSNPARRRMSPPSTNTDATTQNSPRRDNTSRTASKTIKTGNPPQDIHSNPPQHFRGGSVTAEDDVGGCLPKRSVATSTIALYAVAAVRARLAASLVLCCLWRG
jgi:hypothetical protein